MRKTRLKQISKRKLQQYKDEEPIRIELCERAGGEWRPVNSSLVGGYCKGGLCEICKNPPNWMSVFRLEPHEQNHRGNGGKLTMENSKMVCRSCHDKEHGK